MKCVPEASNTPPPAWRQFLSYLQSIGKIVHDTGQAGECQDGDQSKRKLE